MAGRSVVVAFACVVACATAVNPRPPCKGDCGQLDFSPRGVPASRPLRRYDAEYCANMTSCESCVSEEGCGWCADGINHATACVAQELASTCGYYDPNTCKMPVKSRLQQDLDEGAAREPEASATDAAGTYKQGSAKQRTPAGCSPWNTKACIERIRAGYKSKPIKTADHCTQYQSCSSCLA